MSIFICHDPFARGGYRRFTHAQGTTPPHRRESCRWCGQQPARLYTYVWEGDAWTHRAADIGQHRFCSFPCFEAYYT